MMHQLSRVHTRYSDDVISFEVLLETAVGHRVAEFLGERPDNQPGYHHGPRLVIATHCAVVSDVRVGHHHHLPVIARIGKNLLVARHTCVKAKLTAGCTDLSDSCSVSNRTVGQSQYTGFVVV